jgi:mRNA-degrading endonuclease RelE of RelBE toxin-antitoxin system
LTIDCTERFEEDIQNLEKEGYHSVCEDVKDFISKCKTTQDFFDLQTALTSAGNVRTIKHRVKDSGHARGTSSGFRIILIVNKKTDKVTLCHIYPKRGSVGKVSASKDEMKEIINEYSVQYKSQKLREVKFLKPAPAKKVAHVPKDLVEQEEE